MSRQPYPVSLLFRPLGPETEEELEVARRYFTVRTQRTDCQNELVIPRYSALPFYPELEKDLQNRGCRMINTYAQHQYVADLRNWVGDLAEVTPKTYYPIHTIPDGSGPLIVKGVTNSRKDHWKSMMYAANKREAIDISVALRNDSLIGQQEIVAREFVPLETLMVGLNGQPITREFRFFCAYGRVLCGGYYWASHLDDLADQGIPAPNSGEVPWSFLKRALNKVKDHVNFVVIDVAKTASGEWIVVELNDGSMSGPSCVDLDTLYGKLWEVVQEQLYAEGPR